MRQRPRVLREQIQRQQGVLARAERALEANDCGESEAALKEAVDEAQYVLDQLRIELHDELEEHPEGGKP